MGNPHGNQEVNAKLHDCQHCSVCNQDWHKLHMPVNFVSLKECLGKKLLSKVEASFHVVKDDVWKDKDFIKRLFKSTTVNKHNIENVLLQLIKAELLKLKRHVNPNAPDSIDFKLSIMLGKDFFPKFLMQCDYVGMQSRL